MYCFQPDTERAVLPNTGVLEEGKSVNGSTTLLAVLALAFTLTPGAAHANTFFTWSGVVNGNIDVAGDVDFSIVADGGGGYDLVITLQNTAAQIQSESSAVI